MQKMSLIAAVVVVTAIVQSLNLIVIGTKVMVVVVLVLAIMCECMSND